ncbi:HNH endonuclease signature motif containing protein [Agrococcus casei]|uniref:HNH endonuclease signature motif containing protein n=1 Tax=Agrococcus casei TaxID=343512 RepID=UPI000B35BCFB|nr:HNH endonuclease signature motif containing protein [Agrococcus casei]
MGALAAVPAAARHDASLADATAALRQAAQVFESAYTAAIDRFDEASDRERLDMVVAIGQISLTHEALLSKYSQMLDTVQGTEAAKSCGYSSTADLLQHEHGLRKSDADAYVRLAALLERREYPALADAVDSGAVSSKQAIVIARFLDRSRRRGCGDDLIGRMDGFATDFAVGADTNAPLKPEALKTLIRSWLAEEDPESVQLTEDQQHDFRECSYFIREDGMVSIHALLPAALGAAVIQYLDANAAPRVLIVDADEVDDLEPRDGRRRKQKAADAFVRAFEVVAKSKHTSIQGGAAPTLLVTVKASELEKHAKGSPAVAHLDRTQEVVPAAEAARIVCDGAIQTAITDDSGHVLKLGRSQRLFTPDQRRAITAKYRTCQAPSCDIPGNWAEIHHVQHWQDGGRTDIDNGVPLCNFHHHEVHRDRLQIVHDPKTGDFRVTRRMRR